MSDVLKIINDFSVNNPAFMTWSVAVLFVVLGLLLQREFIKEQVCEWLLNKLLKNVGLESLHNITIPDGMDGNIFVEYLILMPKKILLLGVKKYQGLIFAADKIDLWTQVLGTKSYKFDNPLRQLESDTAALNAIIENSKIEARVLFINGSEFPKGKPDSVVTVNEVKKWSENMDADVSDDLRKDWQQLLELSVNNDLAKGVLIDKDKSSAFNFISLIAVVIALVLWLIWREII